MHQPVERLVQEVASFLLRRNIKVVFAESCTGGLISATLARVPGISAIHCGSAVVYRLHTKTQWLGVPAEMLIDPGPVSEPVARAMAEGALSHTAESDVAVAITGHLGPNAPEKQDGQIFVGIATRQHGCRVIEHRLPKFELASTDSAYPGVTEREQRQWAAVEFVFQQMAEELFSETVDH